MSDPNKNVRKKLLLWLGAVSIDSIGTCGYSDCDVGRQGEYERVLGGANA